jgi:hypothetical protein
MAADTIRFRSNCKQVSSGFGAGSGGSSVSTVSFSTFGFSSDTSAERRFLRNHMRASFIAMRVSQVEKEEFLSNCLKCMKAF